MKKKIFKHDTAKHLFEMPIVDRKHKLAVIEMEKGEEARKEIEFEINIIKRESEYLKDAQMYYDILENVGTYPSDYKLFPVIKKEIFRKVNNLKNGEIKRAQAKIKKNSKIIEKLFRYRIKHEKGRFSEHLIPKDRSIKGITVEISMEVDRLFYIWKRLYKQHKEIPHAKSYGLSVEEEKILKKIEEGVYTKKGVELIEKEVGSKTGTKAQLKQQLLKNKDLITKVGDGYYNKGKERVNELARKNWYRNNFNRFEFVALKEMGYEESSDYRSVYDLNGKKASVIAYHPGGFRNKKNKGDKRESLHHFSKSYLLKELIPKTVIEYQISNTKYRVDAMIHITKNKKIGIEFQGVLLSVNRLIEKINHLLDYLDMIIIVCKKDDLGSFNKIKHEKVVIMYNKQFFTDFVPKYKEL